MARAVKDQGGRRARSASPSIDTAEWVVGRRLIQAANLSSGRGWAFCESTPLLQRAARNIRQKFDRAVLAGIATL